jgi:hypothetical protein
VFACCNLISSVLVVNTLVGSRKATAGERNSSWLGAQFGKQRQASSESEMCLCALPVLLLSRYCCKNVKAGGMQKWPQLTPCTACSTRLHTLDLYQLEGTVRWRLGLGKKRSGRTPATSRMRCSHRAGYTSTALVLAWCAAAAR